MNKTLLEQFYTRWQLTLAQRIEGYIYDENKNLLPTRNEFLKYKKIIERFLTGQLLETEKVILMPGIRGVGKSTLLAQLYTLEKFLGPEDRSILENIGRLQERLYLDVSQMHLDQISLNEFFNFYEEIKGIHLEKPQKKILILLDEVHFDENWGLFLKTLFDRTKAHKDILLIATGSSALQLKMIADLSRRTEIWEIFPMKFSEYLILRYGKSFLLYLSEGLQEALFDSLTARGAYKRLKDESQKVTKFFIESVSPATEQEFFEIGSFPHTIKIKNKAKATEKIKSVIDSIISKDIITLQRFKTQTIAKIDDLLYLLAQSDLISFSKLKEALKIERIETLENLIEVLIIAGVLVKVKTYGKTYGATRKTPKFLFIAPSLRSAILNNYYLSGIEGKKIEDYFALIYTKDLRNKLAIDLSYDFAEAGADFILTLKDRSRITIEVGFDKEEISQVVNTQKKVKSKYGIIFGSRNLELLNEASIIKVPLRYLLLM